MDGALITSVVSQLGLTMLGETRNGLGAGDRDVQSWTRKQRRHAWQKSQERLLGRCEMELAGRRETSTTEQANHRGVAQSQRLGSSFARASGGAGLRLSRGWVLAALSCTGDGVIRISPLLLTLTLCNFLLTINPISQW
jgi:hypothetical protein